METLRPLLPENWRLPERDAFLTDMAEAVAAGPYPGYPPLEGRLHIAPSELRYDSVGRPIFPADPNAPYTVFDHSVSPPAPRPAGAFHDTGDRLPSAEAAKIANSRGGMTEDSRDFPLHRYAVDMATDPRIGLIIGPGYYYHPGKKLTVDLGVGAQAVPAESGPNEYGVTPAVRVPGNRVALNALYLAILEVRRTDTKQLALPGGDIDPGEDPLAAALREAREETGMEFDTATSLGRRLVADPRLTSCTETESELFAIDAGEIPVQKPEGSEETDAAEWLIVNSALVARYRQFGSHRRMLFEFVDWYQQEHNVTIMEDGRIVPNA